MNEAAAPGPASGFGTTAAGDAVTAGTMLRQAREASGLHVATVAIALKVPVRKLEALEGDRFDELPDAVFVRALAASVCRTLKIDPAPILQLLPATSGPRLAATEGGINAPFRSPRDGAGPTWREQVSRPVFVVVFVLLLGALVLLLLPSRHEEVAAAPEPVPAEVPETAVADAAASVSLQAPGGVSLAVPSDALRVAGSPSHVVVVPAVETPAALAPAAPAPMSAASAAPGASGTDGIVVFKARAASWVQVTDAKGAVPLRKLLAAGESAGASGPLPLAVTVGSVSATDVQVRGKPFDLAPVARDNVARFEVK